MTTTNDDLHAAAAALGRKGGSGTSERKTAANRAKASKPPKPGKQQRGRPKKEYIDTFTDQKNRIDVECPYCHGLHSASSSAIEWACRRCCNVFTIPNPLQRIGKKKLIGGKKA